MLELVPSRPRDLMGLPIGRVLPLRRRATVGPVIFLDHMGPVELGPGHNVDVPPHPHIGLATLTWLFDGALIHRDSLGSEQRIEPGDVNWMTAGRGVVHSERSPKDERGTTRAFHGLQSWIALPSSHEDVAPSFAHHPRATLPRLRAGAAEVTLVAGSAFGATSPVEVASPLVWALAELPAGGELPLPPEGDECGVYALDAPLTIADEAVAARTLAVFGAARPATVRATADTRVLLVGGDRLEGPRHIDWNFVSSSPERIRAARERWRARRFDPVPGETEFVPLPD